MFATGLPKLLQLPYDQPCLRLQRSGMLFFSHHPDGPMCAHRFTHRILTRQIRHHIVALQIIQGIFILGPPGELTI